MTDKNPINITPFAVRPKVGAQLAGVGLTKFYEQLAAGHYETWTEDGIRMVTVRSIFGRQQRQLEAASGKPPQENPSQRRGGPGRPRKDANAQPGENQRG